MVLGFVIGSSAHVHVSPTGSDTVAGTFGAFSADAGFDGRRLAVEMQARQPVEIIPETSRCERK